MSDMDPTNEPATPPADIPAIIPLEFEGGAVRLIDRDGAPWWVLADVCKALDHSDPSKAAERLDPDEKGTTTVRTPSGDQQMLVINESGLYSLILTSRKPAAKRFKKWVTAEVLPSIRRTGRYVAATPGPDRSALALSAEELDLLKGYRAVPADHRPAARAWLLLNSLRHGGAAGWDAAFEVDRTVRLYRVLTGLLVQTQFRTLRPEMLARRARMTGAEVTEALGALVAAGLVLRHIEDGTYRLSAPPRTLPADTLPADTLSAATLSAATLSADEHKVVAHMRRMSPKWLKELVGHALINELRSEEEGQSGNGALLLEPAGPPFCRDCAARRLWASHDEHPKPANPLDDHPLTMADLRVLALFRAETTAAVDHLVAGRLAAASQAMALALRGEG